MSEKETETKNYGFRGLLPLLIFLVLYVGSLVTFTILKVENPSSYMPRQVAILIALMFAMIYFEPKAKFKKKLNIYLENAGSPGIMMLGLIVLMAGGFSKVVAASGGQNSIVNLGISLIPSNFIIPGVFAIASIISLSIGTSMGTIVTMMPVTFALARGAGLDLGMAGAAVITGSYFGDGLSMIGGTTISAAAGVGADMREKFLWQLKLAIPSALLTIVAYGILSLNKSATGVVQAGDYNLITIIPYFAVLILAIMGLDVILVLAIGIVLAGAIGIFTGNATFFEITQALGAGMEGMFWLAVFSMLVSGMVGLIRYYGGIDWLVGAIKKRIKSKASCEALIGILTFLVSAAIVNNNVAVLITAPVAKDLGERYQVESKRLAAIISICAVTATMVIPHGMAVMMALAEAGPGTTYLDILKYQFYPVILLATMFIVIAFGSRKGKKEANVTDVNGTENIQANVAANKE